VAQTHDEHLTTEQLSAAFDKQLSPQEQAAFDAHISNCRQCQINLTELRLTAVLLHALPEEEVPRSFLLSSNLAIVPDQSIAQDTTSSPVLQKQPGRLSTLQRSIRIVSTLAAVLALFFIISGLLPFIFVGGASSNTSTGLSSQTNQNHSATSPGIQATPPISSQERAATTAPTPAQSNGLTQTGTATAKTSPVAQTNQGPGIPPVLDPGQPAGRLGLGIILFILGSIGLLLTRHRRVAAN
jgi:anti-sigma factor RsiW